MSKHEFDIIVVGGGITGLTFALALAKATPLKIAILEAKASVPQWDQFNYHHRVSAITLASQRIFAALNVWPAISAQRVSPFRQISVWDEVTESEIHFEAEDISESNLGYIVENNLLELQLNQAVASQPTITRIASVRLVKMQYSKQAISIIADNQDEYVAKLAIAADGVRSWLRQESGIAVSHVDYQASAIVTHVRTTMDHERVARQVFTEHGPLAFLPLAEKNLSSIVWSLPSEMAKKLLATSDDEFKLALQQAFAKRLGAITDLYTRYTFPLHFQKAKQYLQNRVVLLGDAAHQVHPLAGQGVNIGILDAASLAEIIIELYGERRDFAHHQYLRRYERWRKADNLGMLFGIECIRKLFASHDKTIIALRGQGLQMTNRLHFIKKMLMQHAVGKRGRLPHLAKS